MPHPLDTLYRQGPSTTHDYPMSQRIFLTRPYTYPGIGRMLVLKCPALDDGLRARWRGDNLRQTFAAMLSAIDAPHYLLQARSVSSRCALSGSSGFTSRYGG